MHPALVDLLTPTEGLRCFQTCPPPSLPLPSLLPLLAYPTFLPHLIGGNASALHALVPAGACLCADHKWLACIPPSCSFLPQVPLPSLCCGRCLHPAPGALLLHLLLYPLTPPPSLPTSFTIFLPFPPLRALSRLRLSPCHHPTFPFHSGPPAVSSFEGDASSASCHLVCH